MLPPNTTTTTSSAMRTLLKPISDTNRQLNTALDKCYFQKKKAGNTEREKVGNTEREGGGVGVPGVVLIPHQEARHVIGREFERRVSTRTMILRQNKRFLYIGCAGAILLAISSLVFLIDPVNVLKTSSLSLTNGSFLFNIWKEPPVEVFVKMYLFTVLNKEAFMAGREKLKVKEIGPFVYKELLVNNNITFNDNNTISYVPSRKVVFRPDMSCDIPLDTYITVPNVPFIAFTAMLAESSMFTNLGLIALTRTLNAQPFLNITVEEYMWGYEDSLTTLASTVMPAWITFPRFGLMDRMFDDGENLVTMNVNEKATRDPSGRLINPVTIDQYNGSPGLKHWGYEDKDKSTHKPCNTLQGVASEGVVLHRNIQPTDTFLIYRKAFCRTIKLVFDKASIYQDSQIPVYWYKIPDDVFDNENPDNSCFQPKKGPKLPWGLSDVTPCYYKFPAAVSFPHFFNADPKLLANIDGLKPSKADHATYVILQPDIGTPIEVHSRMQTNVVIGNTRYNYLIKPFNNITLPLFWADLTMNGLPEDLYAMIRLLLLTGPLIQNSAIVVLGVTGIALMLVTIVHYWFALRVSLRSKKQFNISRYAAAKITSQF